jgi:hypothetical protein
MPYIGTQPNDVKKNTGVYTPSEILQLTKEGSWGGSLELIEEINISSTGAIDITNIKENVYDVHLLTFDDFVTTAVGDALSIRLSNDSGSTFETSNYQYALQYGQSNGTFGEIKTTSGTGLKDISGNIQGTNTRANGYVYLYNLGNSSKYSFITFQSSTTVVSTLIFQIRFGGGVYTVAETINALRIDGDSFTGTSTGGNIKLYGVKQ